MAITPLEKLVERLRSEAELLRRRGLEREARLEESIAEEVEAAFRDWRQEELTVAEAAGESGYSKERLRELVRERKIPDPRPPDSQGEIRIRRCDLPRKPGLGSRRGPPNGGREQVAIGSRAQMARSVVDSD